MSQTKLSEESYTQAHPFEARVPQVVEHLGMANTATMSTNDLINQLTTQLGSVLRDNNTKEQRDDIPVPQLVPVANQLRDIYDCSVRNNEMLMNILERLEI